MINAKEAKDLALQSATAEISSLNKIIQEAANKGEMGVYVKKISDAARIALQDAGYKVKISLVEGHEKEIKIEW